MGAFICQISQLDWPTAREKGVYGNRENKPNTTEPLRPVDRLSVIRDMISVRPGDLLFFHVIGSGIYGPYQARSIPYYDNNPIWSNVKEAFPFRVLFEASQGYEPICRSNMHIKVLDVYASIENREIWSLATLENERNIEKRAVRKISIEDANTILNIFLREFSEEALQASLEFYKPIYAPLSIVPMRHEIKYIGRYENAIKALLMHKLADADESCAYLFPNHIDFMNETFIAPTTRKLIDILILSQEKQEAKHYYILEAKTDIFTFNDLRQLLGYIDLFRQKPIFDPNKDKISACALAKGFDRDTIHLRDLHNSLCPYDHIVLIEYKSINNTTDAELSEVPHETSKVLMEDQSILKKWGASDPRVDIVEKATTGLPIYPENKYVSRKIKKKIGQNGVVIEERSNQDNSITRVYLAFISEECPFYSDIDGFFQMLYFRVAPLVQFDFKKINPVIIAHGFEPTIPKYISIYNNLSVRRPIALYSY